MRGFVSGVFWGLVLSGLGLATLSLLTPLSQVSPLAPPLQVALAPPPDAPAASGLVDPVAADQPVQSAKIAPATLMPAPEKGGAGQGADTDPGTQPDIGAAALQPAAPDAAAFGAMSTEERLRPLAPVSQPATAPLPAPQTQPDPLPAALPAAPARPGKVETGGPVTNPGAVLDADATAGSATEPGLIAGVVARADPPSLPGARPATVTAPKPGSVPEIDVAAAMPRPDPAQPVPEAPAPATPKKAPAGSRTPAGTPDAPEPVAVAPGDRTGPVQPRLAALPQAGVASAPVRIGIGQRVLPLTERAPKAEEAPCAPDGDTANLPPLKKHAAAFAAPADKPLMAIVLIDDADALGVEALADFPYPLTFAVDPTAPDAAEKMARHRAAGFEVVALVDLPQGATAQDAEVLLSAGFDTLTEAVGVLEGPGTGIQGSRDLSGQVAAFVKSTGRGLLTQAAGLNTALKLARRDQVPAALVFRDFDGAGQSPDVMRRFLDQAAFRAGQEGDVVMMGRLRPNTISTLLLWGLQDRSRVTLAPVSAVLNRSVAVN
ncbi:divergent polysaccharide deacetylase family protein [Sedimentitalea sp. HM32M-2]|uniref:divergent polysaccharide deacetylase family protein n=1 Tax=Sedimentitalea sp. HM32M-2 TaxID=3351566 RepID=UPI0036289940